MARPHIAVRIAFSDLSKAYLWLDEEFLGVLDNEGRTSFFVDPGEHTLTVQRQGMFIKHKPVSWTITPTGPRHEFRIDEGFLGVTCITCKEVAWQL